MTDTDATTAAHADTVLTFDDETHGHVEVDHLGISHPENAGEYVLYVDGGQVAEFRAPCGDPTAEHLQALALFVLSTDDDEPEPFYNPETGHRVGMVAGQCGHVVARSEWTAGFRACERC